MLNSSTGLQVGVDLGGSGSYEPVSGIRRKGGLEIYLQRRQGQVLHRSSLQLQESVRIWQVDCGYVWNQCVWRMEIASVDQIVRVFEVPVRSGRSATAFWGRPLTL